MKYLTRRNFIVLLLILIPIFLFLADYLGQKLKEFIAGNILAEMIGVCVELLIIIFVFEAWQKREERNRKIKVERRLREFLIFFLKRNFSDFPPSCQPGNFYGEDHDGNQRSINELIEYIKKHGLREDVVVRIQKYCETEKYIFNNLIPVSSDLTNDHFKSWVRIAYFMNAIDAKSEATGHSVIKILENIRRFDNESYTNKLYVGA